MLRLVSDIFPVLILYSWGRLGSYLQCWVVGFPALISSAGLLSSGSSVFKFIHPRPYLTVNSLFKLWKVIFSWRMCTSQRTQPRNHGCYGSQGSVARTWRRVKVWLTHVKKTMALHKADIFFYMMQLIFLRTSWNLLSDLLLGIEVM